MNRSVMLQLGGSQVHYLVSWSSIPFPENQKWGQGQKQRINFPQSFIFNVEFDSLYTWNVSEQVWGLHFLKTASIRPSCPWKRVSKFWMRCIVLQMSLWPSELSFVFHNTIGYILDIFVFAKTTLSFFTLPSWQSLVFELYIS